MNPAACLRCGTAESELGSFFCKPCDEALKNPKPPEPEPRKGPGPRMHLKPLKGTKP